MSRTVVIALDNSELSARALPFARSVARQWGSRVVMVVASERDAELIVMASHQRYGLNRWVNGSVAEGVLLKTFIPLLVIPIGGVPPSPQGLRVLVPLDGTAVGELPLEFLRARSTTRPID